MVCLRGYHRYVSVRAYCCLYKLDRVTRYQAHTERKGKLNTNWATSIILLADLSCFRRFSRAFHVRIKLSVTTPATNSSPTRQQQQHQPNRCACPLKKQQQTIPLWSRLNPPSKNSKRCPSIHLFIAQRKEKNVVIRLRCVKMYCSYTALSLLRAAIQITQV